MFEVREAWRAVARYEGAYEVSDLGRVRSLPGGQRRGVVLRPTPAGPGYLTVTLCLDGVTRRFYVHHLVAAAFIGIRPADLEVCHNNGDRVDNCVTNLRYDTRNANMRDSLAHGTHRSTQRTHCSHGHELTGDNVYELRSASADGGVKSRRRCRACLRRTKHVTYMRRRARLAA